MDYAPLSASCVRSLSDKLYEKRKVGAMEIEKMVKDFKKADNNVQLHTLLKSLSDLTNSSNQSNKKGGLIGLAAFATALGRDSTVYSKLLLRPITPCFYDIDPKVRYCACEALYNILKVIRGQSLTFFLEIFDSLSRLCCDTDQSVRDSSKLLNRLMKEIVGETSDFELTTFIPSLRDCLHTTNSFGKEFVVSWISTLQQLPSTDLTPHIPDLLDGLFLILIDPSGDIIKMCSVCLQQLLNDIKSTTSCSINLPSIINVLNTHCQSHDHILQLTALIWLKELTLLSFSAILPYISTILNSILLCLPASPKSTQISKDIQEVASLMNKHLVTMTKQVTRAGDDQMYNSEVVSSVVACLTHHLEHPSYGTRLFALQWLIVLFNCLPCLMHVHYEQLLTCLFKCISDASNDVVISTLQLIADISKNPSIPPFTPSITQSLPTSPSDPSNNTTITKTTSENSNFQPSKLSSPSSSSSSSSSSLNSYFLFFIRKLLSHFKQNKLLLNSKGAFIIKQLCIKLDAREVFVCVAETIWSHHTSPQDLNTTHQNLNSTNQSSATIPPSSNPLRPTTATIESSSTSSIKQSLKAPPPNTSSSSSSSSTHQPSDLSFTCSLIRILNNILFTAPELAKLRIELKNLRFKSSGDSCKLFLCLYRPWCSNPIATICLCLLTQNYHQALSIIKLLGDMDVTVEFLEDLDQLVQLIESPIFSYLRLQLVDTDTNGPLVRSMYGLLMLLPQSQAFHTLRHRLQCLPCLPPTCGSKQGVPRELPIDFEQLLRHFKSIHNVPSDDP